METIIFGLLMSYLCEKWINKKTHHHAYGIYVLHLFLYFLLHILYQGFIFYFLGFLISQLLVIAWVDAYTMNIYHSSLILLCFTIGFTFFIRPISIDDFGFYWIIFICSLLFSKKTQMIGEGDIYFIFMMGLCLRYRMMLGIQLACMSALFYVFITKKREPFPFAPFLCFGFIIVFLLI